MRKTRFMNVSMNSITARGLWINLRRSINVISILDINCNYTVKFKPKNESKYIEWRMITVL